MSAEPAKDGTKHKKRLVELLVWSVSAFAPRLHYIFWAAVSDPLSQRSASHQSLRLLVSAICTTISEVWPTAAQSASIGLLGCVPESSYSSPNMCCARIPVRHGIGDEKLIPSGPHCSATCTLIQNDAPEIHWSSPPDRNACEIASLRN